LVEAIGEPRFVIGDTTRAHFDTMLALKRAQVRQTGLHDFLAAPWVQKLLNNLFDAPHDGLHGCLVTLMAGDTPLMYQFGPRLGDRAHPWVSSYDPAYAAFSPGQIFLNDCRQPLKQAGLVWYDLSTGQQHYKPAFCNNHNIVHNATVFGSAPQARVKNGFLVAAKAMQKAMGPLDSLLERVDRRMDVIASLELDPVERLRGFAYALSAAPRRMRVADNA
ncbi:MAG: GNAT family N-acetyltransferase, partial [Asticcacaulis sp.]|nr:GNAT family N-acetyltransferase [Asticcacaulis sp.]